MPVIGNSSKPTSYWWAESNPNQYAEKLTMPEDGDITRLGQWLGGWNGTVRTKLCIWDASGVLLGQSAQFTVANKGAPSSGNVDKYEADLTSPVSLSSGDEFFVGFSHDPSDAHQVSGGSSGSGTHYTRNRGTWPGDLTGYTTVNRRVGSYVADYTPSGGGGGGGGGFPTADTQKAAAASSTTWTATYPTNIVAGDLILFIANVGAGATFSASGFTSLLDAGAGGSGFAHLKMLGKIAAGGESGTFSVTLSTARSGEWIAIRIPAASWYGGTLASGSTSNASDGLNAATATNASGNPDPPSETPAWGDAENIWIAVLAGYRGAAGWSVSSAPSGFGDLTTQFESSGITGLAIADEVLDATAVDPGTFTPSATLDNGVAATIAIRPPASSYANGIYILRSGVWEAVVTV